MGDVIWNHIQLACVFLSADKTAISQGQTVFIPQGLVVLGILRSLAELQRLEEFSMHLQIL